MTAKAKAKRKSKGKSKRKSKSKKQTQTQKQKQKVKANAKAETTAKAKAEANSKGKGKGESKGKTRKRKQKQRQKENAKGKANAKAKAKATLEAKQERQSSDLGNNVFTVWRAPILRAHSTLHLSKSIKIAFQVANFGSKVAILVKMASRIFKINLYIVLVNFVKNHVRGGNVGPRWQESMLMLCV